MSMITITVEIPAPPDGWVYDGLRNGLRGEMILHQNDWEPVEFDTQFHHHIAIKHVPPWRPAILDHLAPGQWLTIDNTNGFADLWDMQPQWNDQWVAPNAQFFTVRLTEPIQLWGEKAIWRTGTP
jgi:hypothetical protein